MSLYCQFTAFNLFRGYVRRREEGPRQKIIRLDLGGVWCQNFNSLSGILFLEWFHIVLHHTIFFLIFMQGIMSINKKAEFKTLYI